MIQFSSYALIIYVSMFFALWLAYAMWSRRPGKGIIPFVVMTLGVAVWTFGSASNLFVTDFQWKIVFTHVAYMGITIVPAAWFVFVLDYTGRSHWITRRNVLLFAIEPIIVQILIFTNSSHQQFWLHQELTTKMGYVVLDAPFGPLFWVHAIYSYVLLVVSAFLLIRAMISAPQLYRGQMRLLLIGVFAPWIANIVYIFGLSPLPDFVDITPISFTVTIASVGWGFYRYRLMDIIPVARETIIDNMDDAILVLNQDNRIVDANQSAIKLLNQSPETVIGQHAVNVFLDYTALVNSFRDVEQTDTDITIPIEGEMRHFNLRISGLYNRQEQLTGRILVLRDITNLKKTYAELRHANEKAEEATRLKSQFLATMSHELRTPLNAIIGYTELQVSGMVGELSDTQKQYGERVFANAQHLLGLINDILDLSKIEAGRMNLVSEPFIVQQWVDDIRAQNEVLAQSKNLELVTKIDKRMPEVILGDSSRLKQIVVNLLSNAFKFTNEGTVKYEVRYVNQDTWSIMVSDTGIGIPPHKQETIFHEFQQVDSSSTREYGGTGLGLAIVRKLVLEMAGNIRVNSTLGEGSQFVITLPLKAEAYANNTIEVA